MKKNKITIEDAFTLIELLVVISIFSLIASSMLATYRYAQTKARDARKAQDALAIINAVSLYYSLNNEVIPCIGWESSYDSNFLNFLVTSKLIAKNPQNILPNAGNWDFQAKALSPTKNAPCSHFVLNVSFENPPNPCPAGMNQITSYNVCSAIFPENFRLKCPNDPFLDWGKPGNNPTCGDPYIVHSINVF